MNIKNDFPILKKITFLDSAAGTLKPISVINAISQFYINNSMNPHSHDTPLGIEANQIIEKARKKTAELIDAKKSEIIFTSNTTDSLNKIALMLKPLIKSGDEILYYHFNHNSSVAPFIKLAVETKSTIKSFKNIEDDTSERTRIVVVTSDTNAFGEDIDMDKLYEFTKSKKIILINDAAQTIVHKKVRMANADVVVFSSNKMYGPTGVGILAIKSELLSKLKPITFGGGSIATIDKNYNIILKHGVDSFEPGTPDTANICGYSKAIDYLVDNWEYRNKSFQLAKCLYEQLSQLKNITLLSPKNKSYVTFAIDSVPSQDVVSSLANKGIYLRSGSFCASLSLPIKNGAIRASFGIYNTKQDIDKLITELKKGDFFDYL